MAKVNSAIMMMMMMMAMAMAMVASAVPGIASFYLPPYVPSSCNQFQNDGVMIAAVSDTIWNNSAACNTNYRVRCTGPAISGVPLPCRGDSVVVKVVDYCRPPRCQGTNEISLSQEAFAVIANTDDGRINIEFNLI